MVSRELAGLPAGQRQDELVNGWRRYLGVLTRAGPVVVWIEDLHGRTARSSSCSIV